MEGVKFLFEPDFSKVDGSMFLGALGQAFFSLSIGMGCLCTREKYPYTKVLIVTSLIDPKVLERAKSGCADSLWYKDHGEEEIRSVIHRTLNGRCV